MIRPQASVILTDTGTTITYLLSKEFNELLPLVCPNCVFNSQMGLYQLDLCNNEAQLKFKPIWFKLDSSYYEMPVSSYLQVYPSAFGYSQCIIKIAEQKKNNFGTLGVTFLENYSQYYSISHM